MLNSIRIKTLMIFGWSLDKETFVDNNTIGHPWTAALLNNKLIELDAAWGLFEGVTAGYILKGFIKEL